MCVCVGCVQKEQTAEGWASKYKLLGKVVARHHDGSFSCCTTQLCTSCRGLDNTAAVVLLGVVLLGVACVHHCCLPACLLCGCCVCVCCAMAAGKAMMRSISHRRHTHTHTQTTAQQQSYQPPLTFSMVVNTPVDSTT